MRPMAVPALLMQLTPDAHMLPLAILSALVLAAVALSFFGLVRARELVRGAEERVRADQQRYEAVLESMRESQECLAAELREIRRETPPTVPSRAPKAGLNLSKRSQALRMHRRGDPPERIAAELELPRQEVDLLLKVHRIVMSNI